MTAPDVLLERICVTPPYCKLYDVTATNDKTIEARFPGEQHVRGDKGSEGVSAAELARDMAIAGESALLCCATAQCAVLRCAAVRCAVHVLYEASQSWP